MYGKCCVLLRNTLLITHAGGMALPTMLGPADEENIGHRVDDATAGTSALLSVPLSDAADLPALDPIRPPWPGREVTFGGVTLHVRETPGPSSVTPVVYVHGLSGSATNWTDLAAQLGGHAPGIALDLPGFGRSRPLRSGRYDPAAHADAVLCFLAGLGRPVHVVGNSLGGTVAMAVAARRPELVSTLTLLAPAMPDRRPSPRRLSDPWALLGVLPWLRPWVGRRVSSLTARDRVEQMIRLCFGDSSNVRQERLDEAVRESLERADQPWANDALWSTAKGMVRSWLVRPSLWSVAGLVSMPTLVIWGDRDRLVSPKLAGRTAAALPKGRLLMLAGVGHIPQIEQPTMVARAVLGMWQAVEGSRW